MNPFLYRGTYSKYNFKNGTHLKRMRLFNFANKSR